jgi:lipopolysaccharide transport system ATP-binding protein
MSDTVIKIEDLSKQYRLGVVGTGTLTHDLRRWWYLMRGKEDPYLLVGEENKREIIGDSSYVWALKDINLEVKRGEVLGVIGRNGAGKSTLLKILSKVTGPTTGSIKFKGRLASLLEVGTGFHPELTGRENIYLNGAIMGMTKREITSKLDEIIEFAGVARYIDTPVKRYSSGMMVRLGFSVAAHLDAEILVVDEVLAVGDAEFQKKCLGKMKDVAQGEGRTVLFVSHNMAAVQTLCSRCILMDSGGAKFAGDTSSAIDIYLSERINKANKNIKIASQTLTLDEIRLSQNGSECNNIHEGNEVGFSFFISSKIMHNKAYINVSIHNALGDNIALMSNRSNAEGLTLSTGMNKITCILDDLPLVPGTYFLSVKILASEGEILWAPEIMTLSVNDGKRSSKMNYYKDWIGKVLLSQKWITEECQ